MNKKKLIVNLVGLGLFIVLVCCIFIFNIKIGFSVFENIISNPLNFLILGYFIAVLIVIFVILIVYYIRRKKLIIIDEK